MPTENPDPILSPDQMAADAGISRATWVRRWRPVLPVIQLSPRRIGVRRSAWLAALNDGVFMRPDKAADPGPTPVDQPRI